MASFYNRSDFARLMSQISDLANDAALGQSVRSQGGESQLGGMAVGEMPTRADQAYAKDLARIQRGQAGARAVKEFQEMYSPATQQFLMDSYGVGSLPGGNQSITPAGMDFTSTLPAGEYTTVYADPSLSQIGNNEFLNPGGLMGADPFVRTDSVLDNYLGNPDIEQINITGEDIDKMLGTTFMDPQIGPFNVPGPENVDGITPKEIVVEGVRKIPEKFGLSPLIDLGSGVYDFFKGLPPGEFTPEEEEVLGTVGGATGAFVPPATSPADPGTGTPVPTPRPVGTPGPGNMGSVGRPRGFVTRDDVLVPSTGPIGNIYSTRPDDTRGRFAAPDFRDPYGGVTTMPVQPVQTPTVTTSPATTTVEGPMSPSSTVTDSSRLLPSETMSLTPRAAPQQSPQQILDAVNASDGFQAPEIQSVADLITSGQAGVGAVANQFNVGGNDVLEGLLRGGFQTPAQTAAMLSEQSGNDISEINLITDLLNQGNTTPAEVAAYYSNLQRNDPTAYAQYGDLTNFSAQDVQTELDRINQQRNAPLMAAAQGGVVEKSEGIESLLDRRQQAVNRRLARQAAGQFNQGGAAVSTEKKSLTPTNFQSGGLANKFVAKGAELLGFGDDRQLEITKEAVDLTNYMVDNGLIGEQSRIKLTLPQPGEAPTRTNTGIEGDEEVLNAVTHALFSYYAAEAGTLPRMGAQLKEVLQSREVAKKGGDPSTEALDYFNNPFGFNLSDQGLTPPEAKMAIVDNLVGVDNQGARYRMAQGLQPRSGFELLTNREDVPKPDYKPAFSARDALYSGQAQGLAKGGPPLQDDEGLAQLYDTINRITEDVKARNAAENRAKVIPLQTRLEQATPLERYTYEKLGLEPGLDRATVLPFATRQSGENELAFPTLGYEAIKASMAPLAALKGVPATPEEAMELALSATSGGLLTSNVDTGADILMGMAAKPKGGIFPPLNRKIDPNNPDAYELYDLETPTDIEALFGRAGAESLPANIQAKLIEGGMDEELAQSVAGRAENYLKKSYGTLDDEIRTKILQGKIKPNDASIDESQARLLQEAKNHYKTGKDLRSYFDFNTAYDRDTGIRLYDESNSAFKTYTDEVAKIKAEETPEYIIEAVKKLQFPDYTERELIDRLTSASINLPDSESLTGQRGFPELYEDGEPIAAAYDIRSRLYPEMLDDPAFMQAIENQEPIYDIDTNVLDEGMLQFLSAEPLAEGILTIPRNKLTNMAFPDVVENAQKSQAAQDVQVIRDFSGKHDKLKGKAQENFLNSLTSDSPPRNSRGTFDIPSGFIPAELPPPEFLLKKGVRRIKDFGPDSWFRITKAPFTQLEGALMNHSVGGYAKGNSYNLGGRRALASGEAGVFSLRDNQTGKPRLTTEISFSNPDRPKPTIGQIKGPSNEPIKAEDVDRLFSLWDEVGVMPEDVGTGRMPPSVFDAATYREEYIKFLDEQKTGSGFSGFDV